jgi:Trypsin-like peptidase domain
MHNSQPNLLTAAVVQVGAGRGFIVGAADDQRYVITAAHCLPRSRYPSPHLGNSGSDLTFPRTIGPIGAKKRSIWGELCVLSLTDDIAVFAAPDEQALSDRYDEYEQFTNMAMSIGPPPPTVPPYEWDSVPGAPAWVLSIDRSWTPCAVHNNGRFLSVSGVSIESGMSGSPIVNADGAAIGLISTSSDDDTFNMHPSLADCLPAWLSNRVLAARDAA